MIPGVLISEFAEADLINQARWYQEQAGAELADRFLTAFDATVSLLILQPEAGRLRRFRARELSGLRSISVTQVFGIHLIFYRFSENVISIERLMHGARDLPKRLREAP
jgi:plasmid stabilization system protein ParE